MRNKQGFVHVCEQEGRKKRQEKAGRRKKNNLTKEAVGKTGS